MSISAERDDDNFDDENDRGNLSHLPHSQAWAQLL